MSKALILIDLQRGLCLPGGVGAAGLAERVAEDSVLERAEELLSAYRAGGQTVIHVRLGFESGFWNRTNRTSRFDGHQEAGRFMLGSSDTEFAPEVAPLRGEAVLTKGSVGAFASTSLQSALVALGVREIALAGVATHLAIESTAREAADRSFAVTVAADACTGPEALHRNSIENVLPAFATVDAVSDIVAALR